MKFLVCEVIGAAVDGVLYDSIDTVDVCCSENTFNKIIAWGKTAELGDIYRYGYGLIVAVSGKDSKTW